MYHRLTGLVRIWKGLADKTNHTKVPISDFHGTIWSKSKSFETLCGCDLNVSSTMTKTHSVAKTNLPTDILQIY